MGADVRSAGEQEPIEIGTKHLVTRSVDRSVAKPLHASLARAPPHDVSRASAEAFLINALKDAHRRKHLSGTRREGLRKTAYQVGRSREDQNRVAPFGQQAPNGGPSGTATNHHGVERHRGEARGRLRRPTGAIRRGCADENRSRITNAGPWRAGRLRVSAIINGSRPAEMII
jgi:hypothetical protein